MNHRKFVARVTDAMDYGLSAGNAYYHALCLFTRTFHMFCIFTFHLWYFRVSLLHFSRVFITIFGWHCRSVTNDDV